MVLFVLLAAGLARGTLLSNGNFDASIASFTHTGYSYVTPSSWTCHPVGTANTGCVVVESGNQLWGGVVAVSTPYILGLQKANSYAEQATGAVTSGAVHQVNISHRARTGDGAMNVGVYIDGNRVALLESVEDSWRHSSLTLVGTGVSHTFRFQNDGAVVGLTGPRTVFIDSASVTSIGMTAAPTVVPTTTPSKRPTKPPTKRPTPSPTSLPTFGPSVLPTQTPTRPPILDPTSAPSQIPTLSPTIVPSVEPTSAPTSIPTEMPSTHPTSSPTIVVVSLQTANTKGDPTLLSFDSIDNRPWWHYVVFIVTASVVVGCLAGFCFAAGLRWAAGHQERRNSLASEESVRSMVLRTRKRRALERQQREEEIRQKRLVQTDAGKADPITASPRSPVEVEGTFSEVEGSGRRRPRRRGPAPGPPIPPPSVRSLAEGGTPHDQPQIVARNSTIGEDEANEILHLPPVGDESNSVLGGLNV